MHFHSIDPNLVLPMRVCVHQTEDVAPADPQSFFANVFGGDAFEDFV